MTWIEKESGGEEKWQKEEEAFVPPDNCSGLVYCNASQERYKWSRNIISCIWNTADNTVSGPWGPLVLPLVVLPPVRRAKNLDHLCTVGWTNFFWDLDLNLLRAQNSFSGRSRNSKSGRSSCILALIGPQDPQGPPSTPFWPLNITHDSIGPCMPTPWPRETL